MPGNKAEGESRVPSEMVGKTASHALNNSSAIRSVFCTFTHIEIFTIPPSAASFGVRINSIRLGSSCRAKPHAISALSGPVNREIIVLGVRGRVEPAGGADGALRVRGSGSPDPSLRCRSYAARAAGSDNTA